MFASPIRVGTSGGPRGRALRGRVLLGVLLAAGLLLGSLGGALAAGDTAAPRWEAVASGGPDLRAVAAASDGWWTVGADGTVIRVAANGARLERVASDLTATLDAVAVTAGGTVWTVGEAGTLAVLRDGGSAPMQAGVESRLLGIAVSGESDVCVVGEDGVILCTRDGGASWSRGAAASQASTPTLRGVAFAGTGACWAWGEGGAQYSSDGGSVWDAVTELAGADLRAGCFPTAVRGWMGGAGGCLYSTRDAGTTWTRVALETTATIRSISFSDADHGAFLAQDDGSVSAVLGRTGDGGLTWSTVVLAAPATLRSVSLAPDGAGCAVGDGGVVLRAKRAEPAKDVADAPSPVLYVSARPLRSGTVLLGWSDAGVGGADVYRVARAVDGGVFEPLTEIAASAGPGLADSSAPAASRVSYRVEAIGPLGALAWGASDEVRTPRRPDPVVVPPLVRPDRMSCIDCHVVHVSDANGEPKPYPVWCLDCHTGVGDALSGSDASTRHDLLGKDAMAKRLQVECTDCHNPHALSPDRPLVDPDIITPVATLAGVTDRFCLTCHDGELPQKLRDRAGSQGVRAYAGKRIDGSWGSAIDTRTSDAHGFGNADAPALRASLGWRAGDRLACVSCHDPHGSTNRWALLESVTSPDGSRRAAATVVVPLPGGGADLRLFCGACHDLSGHPDGSDGGADFGPEPFDCTTCHAHGHRF